MRSIYNENFVPTDEAHNELAMEFGTATRDILVRAQKAALNLREVSHEFGAILRLLESELIMLESIRKAGLIGGNAQ